MASSRNHKYSGLRLAGLAALVAAALSAAARPAAADGPALALLNHTNLLDFGRQDARAAGAAQTVTFVNAGTAALTVFKVEVRGQHPQDFAVADDSCTNVTLEPQATCNVTLAFAPATAGARSARLAVETSAAGSPHAVPLEGVGLDPATPSRAVGPVDLAHGFPSWYGDGAGLRLALCLDPGLCLGSPPDPTQPASVTDSSANFPDEAFWWSAEAQIARGVGGRVLLSMATEAAFANEAPAVGEQAAFDRIRIRIDKLSPGKTYKVTHPFGVDTLRADSAGEINVTTDIGCFTAPCNYEASLKSRVTRFLRWDPAVAPEAPAGYVGDPAVPHRVTGSPLGTNFFRVEGPNVGGVGINVIQTDLFAVQGKLF